MIGKVLFNTQVAENIFEICTHFEFADFSKYNCGQFVHIKIPNDNSYTLRRPMSIHYADFSGKCICIIYQVCGGGTKQLSSLKTGDDIDMLLFLGNGFTLSHEQKNILLIGGGIGVAPFRGVIEQYPQKNYTALFGFKTQNYVFSKNYFNSKTKLSIATEDTNGYVTNLFSEIDFNAFDVILACGPTPMLRSVKNSLENTAIPIYASLEERMGCGMGGCAVCVCKTLSETGFQKYSKVCTDGPVFDLARVVL